MSLSRSRQDQSCTFSTDPSVSAGKVAPSFRPLARGLAELEFAKERKLIPIMDNKYGAFLIVVDLLDMWRYVNVCRNNPERPSDVPAEQWTGGCRRLLNGGQREDAAFSGTVPETIFSASASCG